MTTPLTVHEMLLHNVEPIGEISQQQTAGQSFRAPYNGLYRIALHLADYGRRNTGIVEYRLYAAADSSNILVQGTFPAEAIAGNTAITLDFAPVYDSADRMFYLELSAPEATPGNAITAYIRPYASYSEGNAYWAGQPLSGDLAFSLHFRANPWDRFWTLLYQLTLNKPGIWGQMWFYIATGSVYWVLLGILGWQLINAIRANQ